MFSPMGEESRWGAAAAPSASHFSRFVLDQDCFFRDPCTPPSLHYERYRHYYELRTLDVRLEPTVRLMNWISFVPAVFIRLHEILFF